MRRKAVINARRILDDSGVRVVPQSRDAFLSGMALYEARPDKGYSLVDCISMQTMRKEGLIEVLTNDRHFEQEGFARCFEILSLCRPTQKWRILFKLAVYARPKAELISQRACVGEG